MSTVARSSSASEVQIWGPDEDDMMEGDLGYGLQRRPGGIYEAETSHLFTPRKRSNEKNLSPPLFPRKGEERGGPVFQYPKHTGLQDAGPPGSGISTCRQLSSPDSNSELSNEDLRQLLYETLEEVEILKTELEASQRQLEGKEEALKILQSMAVLGKATSHTQAALQKTMEQKRSLEKEINALQWEIEFDQNKFKNIEESWIQKYDRLNCENAVLKENLKLKTEEIKMLKSENAVLSQQYLEALAMLDIKQQKLAQKNSCQDKNTFTEVSGLELTVLGACLCHGPSGSPCSCAKMAASTRKLVVQLKHKLELLQKSKEEAYMMADAFRIAFEQQLMRKNDHALRLTQMDKMCQQASKQISWTHLKEDGYPSQRSKKTLGQKLLSMFPLEKSAKRTEDQENTQEVLKTLIDALNDKEEALAHQRKVSYMLARALEDKDTASNGNKEKYPMKENVPLKSPWLKKSEFSILCDPVHSNIQTLHSVSCICSTQHPQMVLSYTRTLKRSRSLPLSLSYSKDKPVEIRTENF